MNKLAGFFDMDVMLTEDEEIEDMDGQLLYQITYKYHYVFHMLWEAEFHLLLLALFYTNMSSLPSCSVYL